MGPNELKYYAFFLQVIHTFIFSIQFFFYISRYALGVLKNVIFGTLKKQNKTKKNKKQQQTTKKSHGIQAPMSTTFIKISLELFLTSSIP